MKLNGDMIALESRYEIEDLQAMIDCYKAHLAATGSSPVSVTIDELDTIRQQLDVLFTMW